MNMLSPMTRKEFNARRDAFQRAGAWYSFGFVGLIFALLFGTDSLSDYITHNYQIGWAEKAAPILMLVILAMILISMVYLSKFFERKYGLICPTCGKGLADKVTRWKVLVTGKCRHCKNQVFDEEPTSRAATSFGLNREEFKVKLESFNRQTNRQANKLLLIAFGSMIACVPITKYFQRLVDRGGLDWVTLEEWRWFAGLAFGAVCLAAVVIFIFAFRGKFNVRPVPCPECGRSLVGAGRMAVETGTCIYCGCRLFEVPSSECKERFHCE
jgi:hypothetical protein